jgi:lysophospholipase L1-like esterase
MNLIKDREEFNKLISILPDLNKDEVYFISLSARNKYLTMDERKEYSLGQTEMFGREIAQSKEKLYDYTIKKLEATLSYKTTRNGKPIPDEYRIWDGLHYNQKGYEVFQANINEYLKSTFGNGNR